MASKTLWKTILYRRSGALEGIEAESMDVVVISSFFDANDKENVISQQFQLSENSRTLLAEAMRVLKRGGLLFIYGLPHALPYWGRELMLAAIGETRMEFKYWIALDIDKRKRADFLLPSHMGMLLFAKVPLKGREKSPSFLNTKVVRVPHRFCAACNQNVKDYGGKKHLMNPMGAALSDVWRLSKTAIQRNRTPRQVLDRVFALTARKGSEQLHIVQSDRALRDDKGPQREAPLSDEDGIALKTLESNKAVFGICLGHQLMALASGISTYKMHHGHRGLNHPVKNLISGKSEMTSQNHGFSVSEKDIEKNPNVEVTHVHLNDGTIMGFRLKDKKAFCVQYHPEASPGPHDSRYLFDQFIELIKVPVAEPASV